MLHLKEVYNIDPQIDDGILPIGGFVYLFNKYKKDGEKLKITDMDTKMVFGDEDIEAEHIVLEDNHYKIVQDYPLIKCERCLKQYRKTHKCNTTNISYVNAKIKKQGRVLLSHSPTIETINNDDVIHYDIESVPIPIGDNQEIKTHNPYILGFNEGAEFKYMTGFDCIKQFVNYLLVRNSKRTIEAEDRLRLNERYQNTKNQLNDDSKNENEKLSMDE